METAFQASARIQEFGSYGALVLLEQGRVAVMVDHFVLVPIDDEQAVEVESALK